MDARPDTERNSGRGPMSDLFSADDFGEPFEIAPGVVARVLIRGSLMFSLVRLDEGASTPQHSHAEEQMGFILEGEFERTQAGETRVLTAGGGLYVPPHVVHGGTAVGGPCRILDVFTPPRAAYRARA